MALTDFTLSNVRRFYLSMRNPFGLKGLSHCVCNTVFFFLMLELLVLQDIQFKSIIIV